MNEKGFIAKGVLAGCCISMGGIIYLKVGGVAGAVLFAFGLIAVVTLGLNLFTGKSQFVWGMPDGSSAAGSYSWLIAILGLNILGCALTAAIAADEPLREAAVAILDKRLANPVWKNLCLAVGCGFIMTLAVQGTTKGKWLPLLFGIPAFILCGFPHCVADAFYICVLPWDYFDIRGWELLVFYLAIVVGNFLGCNAYRLISPQNKKKEVSGSAEAQTGQ